MRNESSKNVKAEENKRSISTDGLSCVVSVTAAHKSPAYRVRPRHSAGLIMKDGHRASRHAIDRDVRTRTLSLSLTLTPRRSVISAVAKTTPGLHICTHYTSNSCEEGSTTRLTSTIMVGLWSKNMDRSRLH